MGGYAVLRCYMHVDVRQCGIALTAVCGLGKVVCDNKFDVKHFHKVSQRQFVPILSTKHPTVSILCVGVGIEQPLRCPLELCHSSRD